MAAPVRLMACGFLRIPFEIHGEIIAQWLRKNLTFGVHGQRRQTDHQSRNPTPTFSRHEMECPHVLPPG